MVQSIKQQNFDSTDTIVMESETYIDTNTIPIHSMVHAPAHYVYEDIIYTEALAVMDDFMKDARKTEKILPSQLAAWCIYTTQVTTRQMSRKTPAVISFRVSTYFMYKRRLLSLSCGISYMYRLLCE
jgi:hypothetical protein